MRYLCSSFVFLSVGLLATWALAEDKEGKKGDGGARAELREKILKEFDKDGDGKLSDEEREKAREKMRELRGIKAGEKGARGEGRRREAGHRPGGPPNLPKLVELFAKFDKDNDGKLSKDEFKALAAFVHEHMPHPDAGPDGARGAKGGKGGGLDGARSRDKAASSLRFRGPHGFGPRDERFAREFMRRPDGPPFRDGFAMRGFGPGSREERFGWRGPGPGRDGEHFAMRDFGPPRDGRDRFYEFHRYEFHRPDRGGFAEGRGPRDDGPRRDRDWFERRNREDDSPPRWIERFDMRGPGPERLAMRDHRPAAEGDDDDDAPRFDRRDGPRRGDRPEPGDGGPRPRRERLGRPGEGPGPEGDRPGPRGDGERGRFNRPDGPPRDDGPPREGEGPSRFFRGPDGPPRGDGPGPRGERRFERDDRRGPPPGDRDDDDRRPPKREKDDDDKGEKDKAEAAI